MTMWAIILQVLLKKDFPFPCKTEKQVSYLW